MFAPNTTAFVLYIQERKMFNQVTFEEHESCPEKEGGWQYLLDKLTNSEGPYPRFDLCQFGMSHHNRQRTVQRCLVGR
jgi:hypothetical protein